MHAHRRARTLARDRVAAACGRRRGGTDRRTRTACARRSARGRSRRARSRGGPERSCSRRLNRSPSARWPMRRMPLGVSSMRPSRCSMRPASSSSLARFASCCSERAASSPRRSRTLSRSTSASGPGLVALRSRFSSASMSPSWSSRPLMPSSGRGSSPRKRMPWPQPACGNALRRFWPSWSTCQRRSMSSSRAFAISCSWARCSGDIELSSCCICAI